MNGGLRIVRVEGVRVASESMGISFEDGLGEPRSRLEIFPMTLRTGDLQSCITLDFSLLAQIFACSCLKFGLTSIRI